MKSRRAFIYALRLLFPLLLLAPPITLCASGTSRSIIFVLSNESPVYEHVADATIRRSFKRCNSERTDCDSLVFKQQTPDQIDMEDMLQAFLTISLGTRATKWVEQRLHAGNKMYAMLPYQARHDQFADENRPIARIYIDQPYERYFNLIRTAVPRSGRIGLLLHEKNLEQIDRITNIASQYGMSLKTSIVSADRDVGEALSYVLNDIDVLLALPDSRIHNSQTISHILTAAYRNSIPVIGFSSAYVRAGAVAAVYTSPDDIAHQVTDTLFEFLANDRIEKHSQQASYFSISYNFEVARSLGLPLIPPSLIKQTILQGLKNDSLD